MSLRSSLVVAVLGLSVSSVAVAQTSNRGFVDIASYLTSEADITAWYTLRSNLTQNFDDICGDTFCEGDYSNIQSLRFRCSVNQRSGAIGQCVWVFAASNEEVNYFTGAITVETQSFTCPIAVAPGTTVSAFLSALSGPSPLYATVPGTGQTVYDNLIGCL